MTGIRPRSAGAGAAIVSRLGPEPRPHPSSPSGICSCPDPNAGPGAGSGRRRGRSRRRRQGQGRSGRRSWPRWRSRRAAGAGRDRGSFTAEFAAALPALMVLVFVALGSVEAALAQMRCVDAARDAALAASRGGDGVATGRVRAPSGAVVTIRDDGHDVRASVRLTVHPLGGHLPGITVSASAVADTEPGIRP